jgi:hypothetical protein
MLVHIQVQAGELERIQRLYAIIGAETPTLLARVLNHTGDVAGTRVTRALAKQMGLQYGRVRSELRRYPARPTALNFDIVGQGGHLSLRVFNARQLRSGVQARPWGKTRVFEGTFIPGRWSVSQRGGRVRSSFTPSESAGGQVYVRTGDARLPIRKLWGPAIPRELVRDASAYEFFATARERMPARIEHELIRAFGRNPHTLGVANVQNAIQFLRGRLG